MLYRYQFNPHLTRDETTTNILVKALTVFPSPDFSLCLHLLPPHILNPPSSTASLRTAGDAPLSEAVQKLNVLNNLLSEANYKGFWSTLDSDDLYADLVADVSGFEELMRIRIAVTIGQSCREVERGVLEGWLQMRGQDFERFITDICGWGIDDTTGVKGTVVIPVNKENEAKGTVVRENVQFDREFSARGLSALDLLVTDTWLQSLRRSFTELTSNLRSFKCSSLGTGSAAIDIDASAPAAARGRGVDGLPSLQCLSRFTKSTTLVLCQTSLGLLVACSEET